MYINVSIPSAISTIERSQCINWNHEENASVLVYRILQNGNRTEQQPTLRKFVVLSRMEWKLKESDET